MCRDLVAQHSVNHKPHFPTPFLQTWTNWPCMPALGMASQTGRQKTTALVAAINWKNCPVHFHSIVPCDAASLVPFLWLGQWCCFACSVPVDWAGDAASLVPFLWIGLVILLYMFHSYGLGRWYCFTCSIPMDWAGDTASHVPFLWIGPVMLLHLFPSYGLGWWCCFTCSSPVIGPVILLHLFHFCGLGRWFHFTCSIPMIGLVILLCMFCSDELGWSYCFTCSFLWIGLVMLLHLFHSYGLGRWCCCTCSLPMDWVGDAASLVTFLWIGLVMLLHLVRSCWVGLWCFFAWCSFQFIFNEIGDYSVSLCEVIGVKPFHSFATVVGIIAVQTSTLSLGFNWE